MDKSFLSEFKQREYYNQCTDFDSLENLMNKKPIKAYIGFDCTAKSLHVGSLLQIMCLRMLQKYGHQPIVLLGGGTTRIGDPSGKEETKPIFVNNFKWLSKLNYINFLREIGKHFTINKMLSFDSVKLRLDREQSLSYMEFNYMILQAYDFYELNKNKNCVMQIGGSDQWGNIINGVELIKRHSGKQSFGLTTPLITLASGAKMGKSEKGAIWLDKKLLSPYDYWQFWRNTDDRDVIKFLKMFTDLSIYQIDEMKNDNINQLKIILANQATSMLHGKIAAQKASDTAKKTFVSGSIGKDLPTIKVSKKKIESGINIVELVVLSNLIVSKSEVRRTMKNKGIKINNEIIEDPGLLISLKHFNNENFLKLSLGKKKHVIIKMN